MEGITRVGRVGDVGNLRLCTHSHQPTKRRQRQATRFAESGDAEKKTKWKSLGLSCKV